MRHFGGAPEWVTVAVFDAVALIDEIKVCIDVDDMNWILTSEGADARNMHAVVAAKHHRQRTGLQDVANTGLDVVMARDGVSMDDIGIAYIDDGYAIGGRVNDIVFMVADAAMTEGKEGRGLADRAGPETRAGAVLGAQSKGAPSTATSASIFSQSRQTDCLAKVQGPTKGRLSRPCSYTCSEMIVSPRDSLLRHADPHHGKRCNESDVN